MSAIAGAVHVDGREMSAAQVAAIAAAAPVRGFDGNMQWHAGPAGLIRFAHATTPEAVGEVQPFTGESGAVAVFDGRLDNRPELLGLIDARYQGAPDGAIALALFEAMGRDFVKRLAGDFAIAIWQADARRMSLFRSAMGWRPLVWSFQGGTFGFATDARSLVLGLGLERRYNEGALAELMAARFVSETDTLWAGIERVPQGTAVILDGDKVSRWVWHGGPYEDLTGLSLAEHAERFRDLFDQALIAVSRSNGRVTSQLSGGLDSSSVVCRSAELYREGRLDRPVGAISARFPGQPHDESQWSRAVEEHTGITAEVAQAQLFDADAARKWCAETFNLPVRPNALDTMAGVCAVLRGDGRRVILTGEGGDDWLNGSLAHWPDLALSGRWVSLFRHAGQHWPNARIDVIARRTLYAALIPLVSRREREAMLYRHLDWRLPDTDWLRPEWTSKVELTERWRRSIPREGLKGFAQRQRYGNFSLGPRHVVAETAQAYAESQGIEIRHPFHDTRLTRFYMGAWGNHLRRHDSRKLVLREAMRGTLPEVIRTRTSKAYFVGHTVDAVDALLRERSAEALLPVQLGWVDPDRILAMHAPFAKWRADGSQGPLPTTAWGPVWFTLAADMWLQHAFGLK